ncbi:MAG: GyrI-like domain-containing protein [Marinoscillum sp.]|uniref:SRPBCC family protein n=1 Tax=Marinoscillum sp. TaxID=2024838 RepID=UPI0032F52821
MKAIKIVGIILMILASVVLIAIYLLPDNAHMERKILIERQPEVVYTELISFRTFNEWSPWATKDPAAAYQWDGPVMGVGARISWKSAEVGNGSMQVIEVMENRKVVNLMKFDEYESDPTAAFILNPVDGGTEVVWTYDESNVKGLAKIFMLGIDGFLGEDYEQGLLALKDRVESAPDFEFSMSLKTVEPFRYLGIRDSTVSDPALVSTMMAQNYGELVTYMSIRGVEATGNPLAVYSDYGDGDLSFICGYPIAAQEIGTGRIQLFRQEGGPVILLNCQGSYENLEKGYDEIMEFAAFYDYDLVGNPWEEYTTDPETNPDTASWATNIYYPIQ